VGKEIIAQPRGLCGSVLISDWPEPASAADTLVALPQFRSELVPRKICMAAAFELIDGIPNYSLYVGGKWIRSSRNEAAESRNPATGSPWPRA